MATYDRRWVGRGKGTMAISAESEYLLEASVCVRLGGGWAKNGNAGATTCVVRAQR